MQYTIKQARTLPILQHLGWIPRTPWPELELLRKRQYDHLHIKFMSESTLQHDYEQRRRQLQDELTADPSLHRAPNPGSRALQLVPTENELANARIAEHAWLNGLVAIGELVKREIELRGDDWKFSLGDVVGLSEFARRSVEIDQYLRQMGNRYTNVVLPEVVDEICGLLATLPEEARRVVRLFNWIEREQIQPLGLGFAFYEDKNAIPPIDMELLAPIIDKAFA